MGKLLEQKGNLHHTKQLICPRGTGSFTIRADDGSIEKDVPRSRLRSLLLLNEDEITSETMYGSKKIKSPTKLTKRQISYQKAKRYLQEVHSKVNLSSIIRH